MKRALILIPKIACSTVLRGKIRIQLEDAMNAVYEIVKLQNQEPEPFQEKGEVKGDGQAGILGMFMKYFTEEVKERSEIE